MSFWDKLSDALPSKSIARGHELQMSEIADIHMVPDSVVSRNPAAFQCQICKVTPKATFAKNTKIYDVCLSDDAQISIPFADPIARVIQACEGCVRTFNLIAAHKQYVAEKQIIENEQERERIRSQAKQLNREKENLAIQQRDARRKKIEEEQRELARMKKEYEARQKSESKPDASEVNTFSTNSQQVITCSNCGVKNSVDKGDSRPVISCAVCKEDIHPEPATVNPGQTTEKPSTAVRDAAKAATDKTTPRAENRSVECSECKSVNIVTAEKIRKQHIFAPVCSICRAKLIL